MSDIPITVPPDDPANGNDRQFGPAGVRAIEDQRDREQVAVLDEDRLTADTPPLDDGLGPAD